MLYSPGCVFGGYKSIQEMKTKTRPYEAAEYLTSEEEMAAYLEAALEDGDSALVVQALGTIAKAVVTVKL